MDSETIEYQTCVLKVPIHCEGCKKKVKKVLSKIPGVLHSDIDSKLNKVTVTGTIDADSIIKRLIKSNKHAEHWPDERPTKPDPKPDPNTSNESKQKKTKSAVKFQENPDKKVSLSEESAATPAPESAAVSEPAATKSDDAPKAAEPAAKPKMAEAENEFVAEAVVPAPKNDPPEKVADSPAIESSPKPTSSKKKGKKVQKKPEPGEELEDSEQTTENSTKGDSGSSGGGTAPVNRAVYQQPMHQTQSIHAYNMARPTTSNSYYAPAPVPAPMPSYEPHPYAYSSQQAYAHSSHPAQPESYYSQYSQNSHSYSQNSHSYSSQPVQPESYYSRNSEPDSYYSPYSAYPPPEAYRHHAEQAPPAADSYDMFSDENPNACKVM